MRRVARRMVPEIKWNGLHVDLAEVKSTVRSVTNVSLVARGDSRNQRIGWKIKALRLSIRLRFSVAGDPVALRWRVAVIMGQNANTGAPSDAELFDTTTYTDIVTAFRQISDVRNWRLLKDFSFVQHTDNGDNASYTREKHVNLNLPLNHTIAYDDDTNDSALNGRLFLIIWTDNAGGAGDPTSSVAIDHRIRYSDA